MLKQNDKLFNFTVTKVVNSRELGGNLVYMQHDKAGTELVWLDNGELNKLFSIAFKTLPEDSTGVFHILEHSVLCGSEKYPVKEPFVDLLKSSMNTFLNAMTFQDKTMYPVSSRNEKDFLNLTSVYLDAVFAPNILTNPNIFYQEGWHIETDETGKPSYKGVVFNEMKGVMGSRDGFLSEKLITLLFPDNAYGVNSGGDPENIPELTYEKFVETYKRFYHASNARIYLDGSIPLEKTLALIDSYLSRFERKYDLPSCPLQKPVSVKKTLSYALGREESLENKTQLTLAKIICNWDEPVKNLASEILLEALCDSNESAFKKAILEKGLAQDLEFSISDESEQAFVSIDARNVADGKEAELIETLRTEARKQIENGIDRKALIAAINSAEYKLKAPEEPAALTRCIKSMMSWLYGGDPIIYLETDDYFRQLREMLNTDAYEKLLEEIMLSDEGLCILKALPSYTANEERDAKEAERLNALVSSWTEEQKRANRELNEKLVLWQQTEDSEEHKKMLPKLPISELSDEPDYAETELQECAGVKLLYHPINTHGIVHFSLYFKLTDLSLDEFAKAAGLCQLISYLPTAKHSALELEQEIKTWLGDLNLKPGVYSERGDLKYATPCMILSCSVLESNLEHAKELVHEILFETIFDKSMIKDIVLQSDMRARQTAVVSGHSIGKLVAMAGCSAEDAVGEAILGYTALSWSKTLAEEFDERADDYIALLSSVLRKMCCRSRMTVSLTSGNPADLSPIVEEFPQGEPVPEKSEYVSSLPKKCAIVIPAQISYAVQCANLADLNRKYDGSMSVAANILTLDYLWNVVRVQGGAYGTGLRVGIDGGMMTYSYRDPSPKRSIEANAGAGEHLRKLCRNRTDIDNYIISAVSGTEPLVSPQTRGVLADRDYFRGYTIDVVRQKRKEMISTGYEQLEAAADAIDAFAENGAVCIVGPKDKIEEFDGLTVLEM